jgi:Protein of unknown function (DUF559)
MRESADCVGCCPVIRDRDAPERLQLSQRRFQRLIDDGILRRLRRGVVVGECLVERAGQDPLQLHRLQLRAFLLAFDQCVASHESAAVLHGLPLLTLPPYVVGTRTRGAWRGGEIARVRIAPLPRDHLEAVEGVCCTTVPRTVIDVARSTKFRDAVVIGDAALRGGCDSVALLAMLDECSVWADLGRVRAALEFLDERAESPFESVSRAIMQERELPPPELQVEIPGPSRMTYRVDFLWRDKRVVGEADGMLKYDEPAALRTEKVRQEHLERLGFKVVRWTWREMLIDTGETVARLRAALR